MRHESRRATALRENTHMVVNICGMSRGAQSNKTARGTLTLTLECKQGQ